jgi:hypothetical protein
MSKKDLENIGRLYVEGWYSQHNRDMGYDDDFPSDEEPKVDQNAMNLASEILGDLFEYGGDEYINPKEVWKNSDPRIVKTSGDGDSVTTIISLDIPYSILAYNDNRKKMFRQMERTLSRSSRGAGSEYSTANILQHKEIKPGIGKFVIEFRTALDI